MPADLTHLLSHSTTRIVCELGNGTQSTGTGFFYMAARSDSVHVPVIVTNKHVVRGAISGRFLLTLKNPEGLPLVGKSGTFEFDNFEHIWTPHPDPDVDLCAMPIGPLINEASRVDMSFYYALLTRELIPSQSEAEDLIGTEDILMIGYPNGLWDTKNNLPIFRRGALATHYAKDWQGRKEFLVDAACFPGSSGSPVLLYNIGQYTTKKGNFIGSNRIKFLGILYAGPQFTAQGGIQIINIPTALTPVAVTSIPINLGVVIKAEQLDQLAAEFAIS